MSGSLQTKIYGGHRHSSTTLKKMGSYNAPVRRMGTYNHAPKRLGVYTGVGGSKNNLNMEVYPRH
jgi:hypothetical protein